ncbi:MAG: CsbD family protein [Alphaproteobacteria bacterium]|nr:MAG: CsbD family protein [Alphaproteobacteria bacterium]
MDKDRIAGSAKDFAGKVEGSVGDIAGDAKTQVEGRVREATGTAQNLYGQAKDTVREATDAAASYAKDAYENSGDTFRDSAQTIAKKVQDNPLGSMLIAGGIGFALALLMTRPPRRPPPRWRYYG